MKKRNEQKNTDLGREPVGKLLLRLAVPAITAQIVNVLYNICLLYTSSFSAERVRALIGLVILMER